jgi:hypothetical protein
MSTSTTSANGKQAKQRTFTITFHIEGVSYSVWPLRDVDPTVAARAYRMIRRDQQGKAQAVYDIRLSPEGHITCECRGFLRWGHCKHIKTLQAAGMLPTVTNGKEASHDQAA